MLFFHYIIHQAAGGIFIRQVDKEKHDAELTH